MTECRFDKCASRDNSRKVLAAARRDKWRPILPFLRACSRAARDCVSSLVSAGGAFTGALSPADAMILSSCLAS